MAEPLNRALAARGFDTPTPIQVQALPPQLSGRDLLALAETGSGKTAAFALPVLNDIALHRREPAARAVSTLILAPTRELAVQIDAEIGSLAGHLALRRAVILGGVAKGGQIRALQRGVHICVATPGRLLDLAGERHCDLRQVQTLILDEADRMFDMGFIHDIRRIVALVPKLRRTALFSATMPPEIRKLANELLTDPVRVDLSPKQMVVDRIDQKVMIVRAGDKQSRLHTLLADPSMTRVIVFTRTKRGADRVVDRLDMAGVQAAAIHGNKAQNARQRALSSFAAGDVRVLVATDIAARGIDVDSVSHVINFDMPMEPETYVHRIGRTARKGRSGVAISLCDPSEKSEITAIEKLMRAKIDVIDDVGGEAVANPPHARPERPAGGRQTHGRNQGARASTRDRAPSAQTARGDQGSAAKASWRPENQSRPRGPSSNERQGQQNAGRSHASRPTSQIRPATAAATPTSNGERRTAEGSSARPQQAPRGGAGQTFNHNRPRQNDRRPGRQPVA